MHPPILKHPPSRIYGQSSVLQQVFGVARNPGRQWALVTASQPGMTLDEDRRANAAVRQELRAAGLDYWLVFTEWRESPLVPSGEWRRFAVVDGTGYAGFQDFVSEILKRHGQAAALVGVDGQASIIRSTGDTTELGQLDIRSSVAAYGSALGGTGTLTLVRAFVPVGVFGATVRSR